MDAFTDYYAILGIDVQASPGAIKTAFKKLALKYHPDVYKGDDAHDRMQELLRAYQTLNDPGERRRYDVKRSEHLLGKQSEQVRRGAAGAPVSDVRGSAVRRPGVTVGGQGAKGPEVSPGARRDRHRYYDFPTVRDGQPLKIDL